MVRDRAMRDDVGFGPLPVVSHSGVFDGSGASAGCLACVLAVAGLLCVSSAQGQVIREEGFPVKGGVAEESAWAPVVREECDPFTVPGEFGESCAPREKTPDPFGFGPEGEARPGEPSGPAWRTPPRLECPVAIFLEELETGQVECHAWDASGEEHLEYSWEPVGSTTRDYLDNPRLIPEDSPTPSVVAPETPSYETLESFYSGETTFLYRYRLTATSRATGLSSWREVEVYVSGSRPSVYCPLEVSVEEGEAIALDCEGADPLSHRMDYDEDGASIEWLWEGLWGASTSLLDATDLSSALFTAPAGSAGEEYHYIASMTSQASGVPRTARRRVTVRVVGGEAVGDADSSAGVTCDNSPYSVYEGAEDLLLDCDGNGPFNVNVWLRWSRLGEQVAPPQDASSTPKLRHRGYDAIFDAPDSVDADEIYEYTIAIWTSPGGPDPYSLFASDDVRITVLNKPAIDVDCAGDPYEVYEGAADITLDCTVANEPTGATYMWAARGSTSGTNQLSGTTILAPTFAVPDNVDADTDYEYTVTLSAGGVEQAREDVTVTVLEKPDITVRCGFLAPFYAAYEGDGDIGLQCIALGAPGDDPDYTWSWSPTDNLTGRNTATPTFAVPDNVDQDTTWTYTVTASAENADDGAAEVRVKVRNPVNVGVTCSDVEVYEGADDLTLGCFSFYITAASFDLDEAIASTTYEWTARGNTPNTDNLHSTTVKNPTFYVPEEVDSDETYEYTLTVSGPHLNGDADDITVKVLNRDSADPLIACTNSRVYEGAADIPLDCSVTDEPSGATYAWGRRGSTTDTNLLSGTTILRPTFSAPADIDEPGDANKTYEYTVTLSAGGVEQASADVTVTVLEKPDIWCSGPTRGFVANGSAPDFPLHVCKSGWGWRGAPAGSDYAYAWTARNGTPDTRLLNATNIEIPLFDGPEVENHSSWYYRLTVSAENADDASVQVTVFILALNTDPVIDCNDAEVYEGAADITLDCSVTDEPSGATYAWTGTDIANRLSSSTILKPTFDVPDNVDADTDYEYTVTLSASGIDDVTEDVTVKVLNKRALSVACAMPSPVYEGSEDFALDCAASGAPRGSSYTWSWSPNTRLTDHDTGTPTFAVPGSVEQDTTYTYAVTATAENADDETANVTVTVLDTDTPVPSLAVNCQVVGTPSNVSNARMTIVIWEKLPDPRFACEVTDAPENASYVWSWTASTGMTDLALLSADDIPNPFFDVPDIDGDERHEYIVTATSDVGETGKFFVDITVREWGDISVTCTGTAYDVPEGADDFAFDCRADGSLVPPYTYTWSWSPTDRLTDHDTGTPTFDVPEDVDRDTTYVYTATVTSLFSDAGRATVEVTVRDTDTSPPETPGITCIDPDPVYEGADDITLDCSVTDEPSGATYAWTGTDIANRLSSSTILKPAFDVPDNVDADTDYEYTVTLSASGIDDVTEDVTVKVLNKRALSVACATPSPVYEGSEDFALDCAASGAPAGSDYAYEWTARGGGDTSRLSSTTVEKPTFEVPEEVDATTTYEYLLTVSAANAEDATAEVTVTVLNRGALAVICADPGSVYEGSEDFAFDCSASGAPAGSDYAYEWTARGSTANTDLLIAGADGPAPTFDVPEEVDATTTYEYLLTASAENAEDARAEVTVTVLNRGALSVVCVDPPSVYEGSEDFALDCSASGAPAGSDYAYEWTARGSTPNTFRLSAADIASPTFYVPDALEETTTYEYLLTARAENAEDARAEVTVTVLNRGALAVICADPGSVYEGSEDVAFDCAASGAPAGSGYTYAWTARNSTANTDLLVAGTDGPAPTFAVPEEVDEDETYEYTLTVSAGNAESATAEVTVKVLNLGYIALVCASPPLVYEGSEDFALDCSVSGDTGDNVDYAYEWTAIGSTTNTDLLSAADIASPTFSVPEEVDATTTYEYLLTARAANAEDATAEVTVTVLNRGALAVICADPGSVYEGSADFAFDCSASGAPAGSAYEYAWTARGSTTNTALLSVADISSPMFYVPEEVDEDETYKYLLTVSAENAESATAEVTVKVLNRGALALACADPGSVYEGSEDFAFDCSASGAPAGSDYAYEWTARGSTANTDLLIAGADGPAPTFDVPEEVEKDETYEYLLTVSADNAESVTEGVTVTVLNKEALALVCADPGSVYEGSEDITFDCSASGAPSGSDYVYEWTARGSTANTDRLISGADGPAPTFSVPDALDETTTYEYLLTVSAENAESATAEVTVKVLNKGALAVICADPGSVYEGSEDVAFDCEASGAPAGSAYEYAWTARGSTTNTDLLSGADIPSPTFHVPDALDETTTYEYLLTVSAENAESAAAEVSVTVLNKGALALVCADPGSVYEGSADIAFDCSASGAPAGSAYVYSWIAQGATPNTSRLSAVDIPSPTFYVPDEVAEDETYEYLLTASAENAESATAEVTVTVLNRGALALACADPVRYTRDRQTSRSTVRRRGLLRVLPTCTRG